MKVLIADDNITDLNGIRNFIPWEKLGCKVVATARNGVEGVELAKKDIPDLIVADISMPLLDGISMCKEIKKINPNLKILFLSCLEDFEYAKQAINIGNCDYLTKPIDIDAVIQSILKMKNTHDKEIKKEITIFNLEKEINKNKPQLIKSFLRDVLLGITYNKNSIHRKANEFDIDINAHYTEIIFETNDNSDNSSVASLLCSNLVQDLLIEKYNSWIVDIKIGTTVAIIKNDIDPNVLIDILSSIQTNFLDICNAELTICVGSDNIPFSQLHEEYERLCSTLNDNLFYAPNSIIMADELNNKNTYCNNVNLSDLNKDISMTLASEYNDTITFFINKYIPAENQLLSRTIGCYIIINLNMIIHKMNISTDTLYIENSIRSIMEFKSYSQTKKFLEDMLLKAKELLAFNPNTTADFIIDKIIDIIHKEYCELQTIEDITDKLYLNPLYANRIFKQTTGKTIYEYLLLVRMEKAIDLLKYSSLKASEIGEAVGYKTARYFSTVFKKHTGLSPIQYRTKFTENNTAPSEGE